MGSIDQRARRAARRPIGHLRRDRLELVMVVVERLAARHHLAAEYLRLASAVLDRDDPVFPVQLGMLIELEGATRKTAAPAALALANLARPPPLLQADLGLALPRRGTGIMTLVVV